MNKLGPNFDLVKNFDFNSGVCKVQNLDERFLTSNEKKALKRFLISDGQQDEETDNDAENEGVAKDWAQGCVDDLDARKRRKMFVSKYRPIKHVSPTSNVCERLFSRAAIVMKYCILLYGTL